MWVPLVSGSFTTGYLRLFYVPKKLLAVLFPHVMNWKCKIRRQNISLQWKPHGLHFICKSCYVPTWHFPQSHAPFASASGTPRGREITTIHSIFGKFWASRRVLLLSASCLPRAFSHLPCLPNPGPISFLYLKTILFFFFLIFIYLFGYARS